MTKRQSDILQIMMAVILLVSMVFLSKEVAIPTNSDKVEKKYDCMVVLDAGHGGADSGKVGINKALEKDINLQITKYLENYLLMDDIPVTITRQSDAGLYDENAENKKIQDMQRRLEIMKKASDQAERVVVVSIHQNSYPEEYVHGAQVFYYTTSTQGKELATIIQEQMKINLDPENDRQIKANDSYYLLKKTELPIVIVECGFLSNYKEAEKLVSESYQRRAAWVIHSGIIQYLNANEVAPRMEQ